MTKFVLTYHGTPAEMPTDATEMEAQMADWGAWYGQIGESLVDAGSPFSVQSAIDADGNETNAPAALTGYTVVEVASLDAAKEIAKACPVLQYGSSVQISECLKM